MTINTFEGVKSLIHSFKAKRFPLISEPNLSALITTTIRFTGLFFKCSMILFRNYSVLPSESESPGVSTTVSL